MIYENIPEQAATINDGTGTMWTCKYTYKDFGAISTKKDARGVITSFGYDSLNRMISVSYDTSQAPGVAATPAVAYSFDNSTTSSTKGLLLSVSVGSFYQESYTYDGFNRITSTKDTIDAKQYTTTSQFNNGGQLTQITYPSNRVLPIVHDNSGRLSSVGGTQNNPIGYLGAITYNAAEQMTGYTLGNGVAETFSFDANRLQITSAQALKGATSIMNLTYGYSAQAGQMGTGTTSGNTGQLVSVSGIVSGQTESAAYTYDLEHRVVTSSQTSNGAAAQRRFGYDRWGNRTGVWDAVSGGNQIQSVTLQQAGGVPTNRIQSVTTTGTVSHTYDQAGNLTADGVHTYVYDGQNRLVSVDGGATAQYAYDYLNRRVKRIASGATTHYIFRGNTLLAEHDGATGAVIVDYIYAGNVLIAREQGGTGYFLSDRLSLRVMLDGMAT